MATARCLGVFPACHITQNIFTVAPTALRPFGLVPDYPPVRGLSAPKLEMLFSIYGVRLSISAGFPWCRNDGPVAGASFQPFQGAPVIFQLETVKDSPTQQVDFYIGGASPHLAVLFLLGVGAGVRFVRRMGEEKGDKSPHRTPA